MPQAEDPNHPWYERPDAIRELTEVREIGCGALSVVVDFTELLVHYDSDEAKCFDVIGKLKDMLE